MAITKRAMKNQEEKQQLLAEIEREQQAIATATRVPDKVLSGSYQLAVAWKEGVARVARSPVLTTCRPPLRRSTAQMKVVLARLQAAKALLINGEIGGES